ncbi:hypothetical protein EJV47_27335 [Hymenobacter gummosus]|uniref:Uncharacterized protein n=1 Tax=Hymenobacter gummosus TaxID=1776032 RepID=A0A3S0J576_9BACT|nr:hypothetical protein [Hymenobacter gummosus]RTQ44709.1 hypothetical protein EJV47_27335 [Hymenobacter gummosus]
MHHLDTSAPYWQWQYLRGTLALTLGAAAGLAVLAAAWWRPGARWLRPAARLCALGVAATVIKSFSDWAATGFDHL